MITVLRWLLLPLTGVYALVVWIRNKLYDWNWFVSKEYPDIKTIVVGNLAVGGTGKSPMIEYLIRILGDRYKLAILSRGYGRKTKGYRLVVLTDYAQAVGDESLQFKKTFSDITVAVSEDRRTGIERLKPDHDLIVLDDAFQHRKIKGDINILLFDYHSLLNSILPLPTGDFRDLMSQIKRADLVVITKCPSDIKEPVKQKITNRIYRRKVLPIHYSSIQYRSAVHAFDGSELPRLKDHDLMVLTGIANPKPLIEFLSSQCRILGHLEFPDHHDYTPKDYQKIKQIFSKIRTKNALILTTTKDLQRLDLNSLKDLPIYCLPISIVLEDSLAFDQEIQHLLSGQ